VNESKALLESERKLRLKLEEQIHALEAQLQLQIDVPEVDNSEEITAHIFQSESAFLIFCFDFVFHFCFNSRRKPMTKTQI
jgi:hypothetical protein